MKTISRLIVCGDSYNARALPDRPEYKGTHWSEILSNMLQCELINIASPGCSNRMIVFQLMEAATYSDSLIIGAPAASHSRFDILRKIGRMHDTRITLTSFENETDLGYADSFLLSLNIGSLERENRVPISDMKHFLKYTPVGLFKHIDKWGIFYALSQLKMKNANFLFFQDTGDEDLFTLSELTDLIGVNRVITCDQFSFKKHRVLPGDTRDPGYHTFPKSQIVLADYLFNRITNEQF